MSHVTVSLVGIYMLNPTLICDTNCDRGKRSAKGLQRALAVVFYCFVIIFAVAPLWLSSAAAPQEGDRGPDHLLTRDEGLAIVDAISHHHKSLHSKRAKPDCSH